MTAIEAVVDGDRLLATVTGAVDVEDAYKIPDTVYLEFEPRMSTLSGVDLDLSGVSFMDSTGLSMLLRTHQEVTELGGTVVLRHPSDAVARLLQLTAMDAFFTIRR